MGELKRQQSEVERGQLKLPNEETHCVVFFFFNDTATTEIYTLSLHDALPICAAALAGAAMAKAQTAAPPKAKITSSVIDRKSTRLNSSHSQISYAVFCLKKKKHRHHTVTFLTTATDGLPCPARSIICTPDAAY